MGTQVSFPSLFMNKLYKRPSIRRNCKPFPFLITPCCVTFRIWHIFMFPFYLEAKNDNLLVLSLCPMSPSSLKNEKMSILLLRFAFNTDMKLQKSRMDCSLLHSDATLTVGDRDDKRQSHLNKGSECPLHQGKVFVGVTSRKSKPFSVKIVRKLLLWSN